MMTSRASSDSALTISTSWRCANRQVGEQRIGREIHAQAIEQRLHLGMEAFAVDQPQRPAIDRLAADEDIGRDVEIVEQIELLMDEGDARLDRIGDVERARVRRRRCG